MYSEKTFKNYIFWIQVKRVVLIILLSCIGSAIGVGIGAILKGTANITTYNSLITIVSTIIFFLLSLVLTAGTGKEIQDGYWKMAVLRKLTAIQKTLEASNELLARDDVLQIDRIKKLNKEILGETEELQVVKPNKNDKEKNKRSSKKKKIKKPEINK